MVARKKTIASRAAESSTALILQCPRCKCTKDWDRAIQPEGPGYCPCKTRAFWNVVKQHAPARPPGHVIVMADKGWQHLRGPRWQENAEAWQPYPVIVRDS